MTRDEHKNIVNQLLGMVGADNQASASDLLTQLTDDYNTTLDSLDTANTNVTQLTENNERLRDVNAKLFLKVGEVPKGNPNKTTEKGNDGGDDKKLTFEALFNEKGDLI